MYQSCQGRRIEKEGMVVVNKGVGVVARNTSKALKFPFTLNLVQQCAAGTII